MKKLFIFEDDKFENFYPLTYNRPVYELLFGILTLRKKLTRLYPSSDTILLCRDYISDVLKEKTKCKVNHFEINPDDQLLFLNGRTLGSENLPQKLNFSKKEKLWLCGDELLGFSILGSHLKKIKNETYALYQKKNLESIKNKLKPEKVNLKLVNYLWELVAGNPKEIEKDFEKLKPELNFKDMTRKSQIDSQAKIYNPQKVFIGRKSQIEAQVVLDAREGPIYVGEEAVIQSHTRIGGPAFIGNQSFIVGGKIGGGCSIGEECRVGGEVENSIFLGCSNKYHQGFLGHSYVGEWVNLGALTTNSDLKNNYKKVKVILSGKKIDTDMLKVGCFLGDHVKTGIGTLLNTGINIGLGTNVYGGGMLEKKFIPSFSWGGEKGLEEYRLDKFLSTAAEVKKRRDKELSRNEKRLFKKVFELTRMERKKF
ncbi:MAG: hypothetical protein AMJ90_09615 [candidate division Zixibacteria bacterium SM23_73_2]|nr:MAG: hypothetical protein AMJ90_09615 [candidate division Zixibacteria bacterium SM23_73_2]